MFFVLYKIKIGKVLSLPILIKVYTFFMYIRERKENYNLAFKFFYKTNSIS